MLITKDAFLERFSSGVHLLDCATGTSLRQAGMPVGCCMAEWVVNNPEPLVWLQRACAEAGSEIIYAPTFQAQAIALAPYGLAEQTEWINEMLVNLSRKAASDCLIAGNLTTLRSFMDTADETNHERMTAEYRRQIRALLRGGADLLAAETLLNPLEALAILKAARQENAGAVMISFAARSDGKLFSGHEAGEVMKQMEQAGAAAAGVNCIAADDALPKLIRQLRRKMDIPLICKPNAGHAADGVYPVDESTFARIMQECIREGANLVGGCCGTTPAYLSALRQTWNA